MTNIILLHKVYVNSLIFKIVTDEITGASKSLSVFGIQFDDITSSIKAFQRNRKTGHGLFYSLFEGNKLTQADVDGLKAFAQSIDDGIAPSQAMQKNLSSCSVAAKQYALNAVKAGKSTVEMTSGLKATTLSAKAGQIALKGIASAANIVVGAFAAFAVSKAIELTVKAIDNYVNSAKNTTEALEESSEAFKDSTSEIEDYNSELEATQDRISELQKLAENGIISIAEENELKTLKEQNKELERKIVLKKQEQALSAQQLLNDLDAVGGSNYEHVLGGLEKTNAVDALYSYINQYGYWSNLDKDAKLKAEENMLVAADVVNKSVDAYKSLIEVGFADELDDDYQALVKVQNAYMKFLYAQDSTIENYRALSSEDKREIISKQLKLRRGFADKKIESIVSSIADEDLDKYYDKALNFIEPSPKDYATAEEYGKAYAEAWLKGIEAENKAINKSLPFSMDEKQVESYEKYKSLISDISSVYADYENLSKTEIANMFADTGYDFTKFITGAENLDTTMRKLADKGLKSVSSAFEDMEGSEQVLLDLENAALGLASNAFGWSDNVGHVNTLTALLDEIQNGEPLEQKLVDEIEKVYGLNLKKLEDGFTFDADEVQDLLDDYSEDYNESLSKFRVFMRDVMGFSEEGIDNFFGKYTYRLLDESDSGSTDTELFDWYETAMQRLQRNIDNLGATVSNVYEPWSERQNSLNEQIEKTTELLDVQRKAYNAYKDKAESVGLDARYENLVKQGYRLGDASGAFSELNSKDNEKLIEQIQEYTEWWELHLDTVDAANESQRTLNELRTQGFEQIHTQYDAVLADFENQASLIEAGLANAEARGQLAVQGFYQQLYANEEMIRATLVAERIALEEALNKLGVTGGEEFDRLQDEIDGVTISIAESENALLEFENAIRDADWGIFDFNREQAQRVMGESDFLLDLLDAKKLVDEIGEFTNNGLASIGLHGVNYNGYLEESIRYTEELAKLEEDIRNNPDDTNYINRYNEILEKKQEMILASESEKEAIADLVRESYEAQKNVLQELIDNYTEALDAEKNLYDQQKRTAEQTKRIADLRKMIASAAGDGSEETRSQIQKWQVELDSAQSDLESDQYDQYISDQKDILGSIFEDYSEVLDEKAEDTERLFQEAMAQAKTNTSAMKDTVKTAAGAVGYDIDTGVDDLLSDNSSLNLNLNQVEARLLANGASITSGVSQIDGTNKVISTNTANLVNNTTGLNEWIGEVQKAIGDESTLLSGELSTIKEKVAAIADKDFTVNVNTGGNTTPTEPQVPADNTPAGTGNETKSDFFWHKGNNDNPKYYDHNSIVDLLRSYQFDDSFAAREFYYSQMGFKDKYSSSAKQNIAMMKWMKLHGYDFNQYAKGARNLTKDEFAWTQENGQEYIIRPSDGAILTPLNKGDSVLTSVATNNLWNMANDPTKFIRDNLTFSVPDIGMAGRGNIENNIAISIPLENVTDVQSFLVEFQRNPKIQAVIKDMIAESTLGTSSLAKYRHKMQ